MKYCSRKLYFCLYSKVIQWYDKLILIQVACDTLYFGALYLPMANYDTVHCTLDQVNVYR